MESAIPVNTFEEANEIEKESMPSADDEVLSLYHTPGWQRVVELIDGIIEQRQSNIGMKEGESPEAYGMRRLSDDEVIKELNKIKNNVESIAKYRDEQRKREDR